jgi:hypothetical protein
LQTRPKRMSRNTRAMRQGKIVLAASYIKGKQAAHQARALCLPGNKLLRRVGVARSRRKLHRLNFYERGWSARPNLKRLNIKKSP